jgi:hypothetical protein
MIKKLNEEILKVEKDVLRLKMENTQLLSMFNKKNNPVNQEKNADISLDDVLDLIE